ncbi:Tat pathway signal sequence, partial [Faecalibacterium prausnitzii]|nr:Tat pathway signal sequence [Faecalibacterium prausnitzii]
FVDCSIITAYGQIETIDNEHTEYTTEKIGDKEATHGTSEIPGQVTCYILVREDAGVSCTIIDDGSFDELMK